MKQILIRGTFVILIFFISVISVQAATTPKLFQTCIVLNGGGTLAAGSQTTIAKYDLGIFNRFNYDDLGGNSWAVIKSLNPGMLIYNYEMGEEAASDHDSYGLEDLNDIGRYNVAMGHPMGSRNGNHPEFFLLDANGNRIYNVNYSILTSNPPEYWHLMDFGSSVYQAYWVWAAGNDIASQKWVADGIFADNCMASPENNSYSATPAKYPTNASWASAMTGFITGLTAGMATYNQRLYLNMGNTRFSDGAGVWQAVNASATPPDAMHEEGGFVVRWGAPSPGAWFYSEDQWKLEIDLMGQIHHSKTVWESHCNMTETQTGTDQNGRSVGFWDAFWYAMCSYLLGKNTVDNNSYLAWVEGGNLVTWYPEWNINLGNPVGSYTVTKVGSVNVYSRQYQKGTVFVNPGTASATITITGSQLSHANYTTGVPVTSITIPPDRGTIVMTAVGTPPSTPTGIRIVP